MNIRKTIETLWRPPTTRAMYAHALTPFLRATREARFALVQLESPYRGVPRAQEYLHACIRDCIDRGETPYASHAIIPGALDDADPHERALGIEAGFAFRAFVERTVVYIDHGISEGMQAGIDHAKALEQEIVYRALYADVRVRDP